MKKGLFFMKGILLPLLCTFSQSPPGNITPLNVGDHVADIIFNNVTNYKSSTAKLSDFKGKLIILDFWSSWCGSCISLFPHLDSLQRKYKDELQIILVNTKSKRTKDDEAKIKKILQRVRSKTGSEIDIPVVYNCDTLDEYFPCIAIPHEVWIDKSGKVTAITSAEDVNAGNIEALLRGETVQMKIKKDRFDVDVEKPLFIEGNGGDGKETIHRSLLSANIEGLGGGTGIRKIGEKVTTIYAINQTLLSLVKTAYGGQIPYNDNRIILSDKERFAKIYCYELMIPATSVETALRYVREDLKRYLNISVRTEKRKMKCLVLKEEYPHKKILSPNQPDLDIEESTLHKYIHNYQPSFIVNLLNDYSVIAIVDETKTSTNISIDLPFNLNDIPKLRDAFRKIGFQLTEEERELEVILISDI